jgi:hypothetical protein
VPPDAGLQIKANFYTLIVGLAGTGDQTRATWVARSRLPDYAIQYDLQSNVQSVTCSHYSILYLLPVYLAPKS